MIWPGEPSLEMELLGASDDELQPGSGTSGASGRTWPWLGAARDTAAALERRFWSLGKEAATREDRGGGRGGVHLLGFVAVHQGDGSWRRRTQSSGVAAR